MQKQNVSGKLTIRLKEITLKHLDQRAEKERRKVSEMARIILENEVDK